MADHDREEAEVDAERLGQVAEGRVQRHPGDDPRQREREDDEERDRLPPEEAVASDGQRREGAEQERDRGRAERRLQETSSASRTPGLSIARPNHFVVSPGIGQTSERRSLKA